MSIRKKISEIFHGSTSSSDEEEVDPDYEYLVSLFGDFTVSESLELSEADYETPEIQALHDAAWEKMAVEGYAASAFFVNGPSYDVRVRLCRKLLQTRIELSLESD